MFSHSKPSRLLFWLPLVVDVIVWLVGVEISELVLIIPSQDFEVSSTSAELIARFSSQPIWMPIRRNRLTSLSSQRWSDPCFWLSLRYPWLGYYVPKKYQCPALYLFYGWPWFYFPQILRSAQVSPGSKQERVRGKRFESVLSRTWLLWSSRYSHPDYRGGSWYYTLVTTWYAR